MRSKKEKKRTIITHLHAIDRGGEVIDPQVVFDNVEKLCEYIQVVMCIAFMTDNAVIAQKIIDKVSALTDDIKLIEDELRKAVNEQGKK